jgi:hypothetical protein
MNRSFLGAGLVAGLVLLATACGDDATDSHQSSTVVTAVAGTLSGDAGECVNLPGCDAVISQSSGLVDGDVVRVRITGWEAEFAAGVAQCADVSDPDNPQDLPVGPDGLPPGELCNVLDLPGPAQSEQADADAVLDFEYEVVAGPSMAATSASGMCDAEHDCVLNVFPSGANRFRGDAPQVTFPLTFDPS